jgi:hypothetical protein
MQLVPPHDLDEVLHLGDGDCLGRQHKKARRANREIGCNKNQIRFSSSAVRETRFPAKEAGYSDWSRSPLDRTRLPHPVDDSLAILVACRAGLKRLEAGVECDLLDDPGIWAELKSAAWAEAIRQNSLHMP